MRLALDGQAHYTDFKGGFELYCKRSKKRCFVNETLYRRVIRQYCRLLAERFVRDGMVDLPRDLGSLMCARLTRKPQYRGKQFIGYGKKDWTTGRYDGQLKTFGLIYIPYRGKQENLRCLGYVANRQLFKKIKEQYNKDNSYYGVVDFNDEMI